MNTMHVDGVDYELIPHGQGCTDVPSVVCNGKAYIGQAIPNKPKKDYEILQFRNKIDGGIDDISYKRDLINENWWLNDSTWEILSVKRLSDGEVFTIGDQVWWEEAAGSNPDKFRKGFTIKIFEPRVSKIRLMVKGDSPDSFRFPFNEVSKWIEDERFFTTLDKVMVNVDTEVVWVVNSAWNKFQASAHKAMEWLEEERNDFTFFAHENNATEFQLMNKPCLSVNDVFEILRGNGYYTSLNENFKNIFIELAKEKINATT